MGVDMKVKAIYDSEIGNITRTDKNWKDVLKVAGQLYRYEFDNIVMVTAQRSPERSTLMADYDTWKKVGRYVKRGAKGCAIFPSMDNGIRSIAFPSISTGVYSFPVELAAKIAVHTVNRFLQDNPDSFDLVEWVLFDTHTESVYEAEVDKLYDK